MITEKTQYGPGMSSHTAKKKRIIKKKIIIKACHPSCCFACQLTVQRATQQIESANIESAPPYYYY